MSLSVLREVYESLDKEQLVEQNGGAASSAIAAASYDGTLYAYPLTASNGYFLFYNAELKNYVPFE